MSPPYYYRRVPYPPGTEAKFLAYWTIENCSCSGMSVMGPTEVVLKALFCPHVSLSNFLHVLTVSSIGLYICIRCALHRRSSLV